jgi:dipeptidyl aminopeptidase/acylaminoacyl peptidase
LAKGEVGDVLGAIRYAKGFPAVDGKRVVLWGFSHGATIALLAASRDDAKGIKAVVAVQGPIELAECYRLWLRNRDRPGIKPLVGLTLHVGGTPEQVPEAWKERSPLYVAARIHCPVLLVYGDKDDAVPADQGPRMKAALEAAGNPSATLILLPETNHGLGPKRWAEVMRPMVNFLNQQVGLPELPERGGATPEP